MSKADKIKGFLKNKSVQGELKEKMTFSVKYPFISSVVNSPKTLLCGNYWVLSVMTSGAYDDSEHVAVHLANVSSSEVFASYTLLLRDQYGDDDVYWKDPENILLFSSKESGDNEWGNDEFVLLSDLEDKYVKNGNITFEVEIEVYGREDLVSNTLQQSIEGIVEVTDLINIADEDLNAVTKRLPVGKNIEIQKKQEDFIIKARTTYK